MKIFDTKSVQWSDWMLAARNYIKDKLSGYGYNFGPSQIFGQILTVLNSTVQTLMLYIEDAMTEQNVFTAQRKKSVYGLARVSGYEPSLGSAARCQLNLTYNSGLAVSTVVIPNHTTLNSVANGLQYIMILDSDYMSVNISQEPSVDVTIVEGSYSTQSFTSTGGDLYSINVTFTGDMDVDFLEVYVNGDLWTCSASLYDMLPEGENYMVRTSLSKGIDLVFGNGKYGKRLEDGDSVEVNYLCHSGELGNISSDSSNEFQFKSSLKNLDGDDVNGNSVFNCTISDDLGVWNGSYSETSDVVKEMVGYNSRGLVLADENNYKLLLSRYSFIGYNRCWSTPGELVVNAMCIKNYNQKISTGTDYFTLTSSDFLLSDDQKESIKSSIEDSGMQYGGVTFNFIDPELMKYAVYVYVRMKSDVSYNKTEVTTSIKSSIGEFFKEVYSDIYIPKSDIIYQIKSDISDIDGVDLYIISEQNENREDDSDLIGVDEFGNILLDNDDQFPILQAGWTYTVDDQEVSVTSPVNVFFV